MATLRFLADESCDFAVVRALRDAGHNVIAVAEFTSRTDDRRLIEQAAREQRILLTEDKDFGWLVFINQIRSTGVILIRYPGQARSLLAADVVGLVKKSGEQLMTSFVVMEPGYARLRRRP